ncbi:MAG: methyltransferase domain-containing protein [Deltaproteobacteria bacterium]|nr:methyltransferase domain-containing protein [Deltaproteobacteria bacterium]MBF0523742.1 methyltransferase domain-containing protein [Deltaproteobacteria bacterium]
MENCVETDRLMTREQWRSCWESYKPQAIEKVFFEDFLAYFPTGGSLIDIGGFPGQYAAYLKKVRQYDVSIIDYIILPEVIRKVEEVNGLPPGAIRCIDADVTTFSSPMQYDLVISLGFLEHFKNPLPLFRQHIALLKPGGTLFASIPNFRGLNGYLQRVFDPHNYRMHNIEMMDIKYLDHICRNLGLKSWKIAYCAPGDLWLEKKARERRIGMITMKVLHKLCSLFLLLVGKRNSKFLSSMIVITGKV